FQSLATNLSSACPMQGGIYVHDRVKKTTSCVSVDPNGNPPNGPSGSAALSADGRAVAFISFATNLVPGCGGNLGKVFLRDLAHGTTECVSVATNGTVNDGIVFDGLSLSADARFVAFSSTATNLAANPDPKITHATRAWVTRS